MKFELPKLDVHHAFFFAGFSDDIVGQIQQGIEKAYSVSLKSNLDYIFKEFENLTVDDAKGLKSEHITKSVEGSFRFYLISIRQVINIEAQNTLLKMLEEPSPSSRFFFIIPQSHNLLPTVKSRVYLIENQKQPKGSDDAIIFLKSSPKIRLEIIKQMSDDISSGKKNRMDAADFLDEIEFVLARKRGVSDSLKDLEIVSLVKKYIGDKGSSVKMLLEYAALSIK